MPRGGNKKHPAAPIEVRFHAKFVVDPSGCWLWTDHVDVGGYGRLKCHGQQTPAHRVAFELYRGPIPSGLHLDHLCRVRRCVNPYHLDPVTTQENIARGDAGLPQRNRTHCPKGHPFDEMNTYIRPDGARGCKACRTVSRRDHYHRNADALRERMRAYYHRRKAAG